MGYVDDDQRPTLWAVNSIFIALATFSTIGRIAARILRKLPFGLDDWAVCIALVSSYLSIPRYSGRLGLTIVEAWDWALYGLFTECEWLSF